MVFSSTIFLFLFLPLTLIVYYNPFISGRRFRNYFLLLASLGFYAWGEPLFVFLMMLSILAGWYAGQRMEGCGAQGERKRVLMAGVLFHVSLLFVFKYLSFAAGELGWLLGWEGDFLRIPLPIGISFFTFQLLSYLFDIYYGKAHAQRNVLNVGLYIALFPQLIAGPIVRYDAIERQIEERRESLEDFADGMARFIGGLGKKALLANYLAQVADNIFAADGDMSVMTAWLGAAAYTLQIYFDFSGYSDMAIGLGRMFGFRFPENFNYPYVSRSCTEFWRRWHISLGSWFRDYVYIPLGGNRVTMPRWVLNLFVVWALTGIWHGANWTFLCWGLFYFVLLLLEKATGFAGRLGIFAHAYAMAAVMVGWAMFRSENLAAGAAYIGRMFGIGASGLADGVFWGYLHGSATVFAAGVLLSLPLLPRARQRWQAGRLWECSETALLFSIFILSLVIIISSTYNPFIYFNF